MEAGPGEGVPGKGRGRSGDSNCAAEYPGWVLNRTSPGIAVLSFPGGELKLKIGVGRANGGLIIRLHQMPATLKEDRNKCVTIP